MSNNLYLQPVTAFNKIVTVSYGRDIQPVGCPRPYFRCRGVWNKFGSNEKSRTFALPFEKRVADEALSSYQDWRMMICLERFFWKKFHKSLAGLKIMRIFAAPFEKRVLAREYKKFIEKTDLLYKKQVPRKIQFIEKR